jgi:hypothetical protein
MIVLTYSEAETRRDLNDLVKMGLVKKTMRNGEEVYWADLSYVDKAKELMKKGVEIHEAYFAAITEQVPNLSMEDVLRIVADHVHATDGARANAQRRV